MDVIGTGDFHRQVAERTGLSIAQVKAVLTASGEQLKENTQKGVEQRFPGFFNLCIEEKKAKEGVNPFTGKKMKIAAHKVPKMKLSAAFKSLLKKKK